MTLTDRAFIKAYQRDEQSRSAPPRETQVALPAAWRLDEPQPSERTTASRTPPAVGNTAPMASEPSDAELANALPADAAPAAPATTAVEERLAKATLAEVVGQARWNSRRIPSYVPPARVADQRSVEARLTELARHDAAALHRRLDAASPAVSGPARPLSWQSPSVLSAATLEAALEVPHFVWPAACLDLVRRVQDPIDQLAANLVATRSVSRGVIFLTGISRGSGRTMLQLALARRLANLGARTVLVDGDFAHPSLSAELGLAVQIGWDHVLRGEQPLSEALIDSREDTLTLLPLTPGAAAAQNLSGNMATAVSLQTLRNAYEVVLVDAGPLGAGPGPAEALMATAGCGAAMLVANVQRETPDDLARAAERLGQSGIVVLGSIENFAIQPAGQSRAA